MYDVIVIGARVAGAPTAMLLARRGYKVLLVDKSRFPSDILTSTLLIWPPGVGYLKKWGVLDAVIDSSCPAIRRARVYKGPPFGEPQITIEGVPQTNDESLGGTTSYAPRRTVLDKILVDAAVGAGAILREQVEILELLREGDRVVGIRGHGPGGAPLEARARLVIGADGANSVVVRNVAPATYDTHDPVVTTYYAYWRDLELSDGCQFEACLQDWGGAYAWPTHDGLTLVGANFARPLNGEIPEPTNAYTPHHADWQKEFERVKVNAEDYYLAMLDQSAPWLAEQCRTTATREAALTGGGVKNFYRKPYGPGWALVGDAGSSYEFTTAHGITNAFREADFLAEAIDAGWSGRSNLSAALREFHTRRDAAEKPFSEFTINGASYQPAADPAGTGALFAAVAKSPQATQQFFGVFAQTQNPTDFFAEDNVATIMGSTH